MVNGLGLGLELWSELRLRRMIRRKVMVWA